ncbi:unnamed protein product (macronuclear) [Paramecium tetraurelia]|uniref:Uncharacterized protein n=1 Tax=Paramecium tetraurelia TaxID=5888 RepID=A0DIA3_PARTE|nr:uncharacterized protein GSPATT00017142001 [Paramecium tetraurelia]CAK82770.1 unnamed protein product [Paramecium tetraurelia]|eukprot:XP_001450167.1 hypothetical protein (macronuclear) [Paramecium tetraurelia strain d4-2]
MQYRLKQSIFGEQNNLNTFDHCMMNLEYHNLDRVFIKNRSLNQEIREEAKQEEGDNQSEWKDLSSEFKQYLGSLVEKAYDEKFHSYKSALLKIYTSKKHKDLIGIIQKC